MKKLSLSLRLVFVMIFAAAAAAAAIGANAAGYRPLDSVQEFLGIAPPAPIVAPAKAESVASPPLAPSSALLVEDFNYSANSAINTHGWSVYGASTPTILVTLPGLSYPGYASSGIGNAATLTPSGEDDYKSFTSQSTGSIYAAALVNVSTAGTSSSECFFHFGPTSSDTTLYGRVYFKKDSSSNNFAFGISKANGTPVFTPFSYALNTTYLIVVKYSFVASGGNNDTAALFVNPTMSTTEALPTIVSTDTVPFDAAKIDSVGLRQAATNLNMTIDGIRVATTWAELFPPPPPPTVNLSVSTNSASEASQTAVTVTATASSSVSGSQTVSLGVSGTGITAGDYTLSNATITIPDGQTTGSVTFTVVDDDVYEVPEIAALTISNPSAGITLGSTVSQNITITDNDNPPNVHFTAAHFAGNEGGVQISIDRSGAPGNDFFVDLNNGAGGGTTCSVGTDYIAPNSPLHFVAGETNKTFTVQFCADLIYEGNESFDIYLANPTGGAFVGAQNFAFMDAADNDTKPTFDISTAATSVDEGVGAVTITVNRSGAPGNVVTVDLGVAGVTATGGASCTAGVDFVGGGQQLAFAAGDTTKTYNVTICNDTVQEPAETFTATITNPQNPAAAQLGATTAENVTINASDPTATTVYVDSSWNCTTPGTDPDGDGPATSCGTDAFTTIAEGIAGVADGGSVIVNPGTYAGDMRVDHPSLIKGKFSIMGELAAQVAGVTVSPGNSPGIITSGSLVLAPGSNLNIELNGPNPGTGHDQMNVTAGPVSIGGANLVLSALGGYTPTVGNQFTIINNQGAGAVIGTFAGLPEGATVSDGTSYYTISYVGGDGNDVVLTAATGGCGNVVSIPAVTSPTGVSVTVPVNTTDLSGISPSVIASDFTVSYDPALLSPSGITATLGSAVPNAVGALVTINPTTPGVVVVSVFAPHGFTVGSIVNLHFSVIGSAGSTGPLTVTGGGFNGGLVCSSSTGGTFTVAAATTTTTVTTSGSPSTYGNPVTFTATVTAATPSSGTPVTTGSVKFYDGVCGVGSPFYSGTPNVSGQVTTSAISSLTAGSHTISACYLANTDFTASSGTVAQNVNQATPVIAVTGSNTFTYNGSPQGPDTADTGGSTSVPTFSYSGTSNGNVAYGPSATKPTLAGSYSVTASVVADANYTAASSAPFAFTIGRATPVVTVTGSTTFTYNGSPQGPTAATPGGSTGTLSFIYEGTPNGGGTYSPSATPPTAVGSYTVTASVAQDDNYNAASSSATPFTIDRATPTLSVTNSPAAFDGNPHSAAVSASVPGVVSNILTGVMASQTDIGVYAVTADFAPTDANNYNTLSGVSAGNFEIVAANVIVERPGTANWFYFDDATNGIIPGHDFVAGPGTPPLQLGSARFLSTGPTLKVLGTQMFNGTRLADISTLSYQTYVQSGFEAANAPMLQFNVDFDLTTADTDYQGRVVYVPVQNGPVTAGNWQTWDTLNGVFWYSDYVPLPTRDECTPAAPCTKAQMLAIHPNMGIHAGQIGGLLFRAQADSNSNVDDLTVGVTSPTAAVTIFDFEQATTTTSVASDANASTFGDNVTFTATIASTPAVGDNGAVDFVIDGTTVCASVAVTAGEATCQTATLTVPTSPHSVVANYLGATNYAPSSGTLSGGQTVNPATSSTVITCLPTSVVYNGAAQTPCVAAVTGAGGLVTTAIVAYADNTDVGTATADATYSGDANHTGSTAAQVTFAITKAPSTVSVAAVSVEYDGNAHPATAAVSGVGTGITQTVTWAYTGACSAAPINVAETPCTATATYAGDSNHTGNVGFNTITITRAGSTTTVLASDAVYDGNPHGGTASWTSTGADAETASLTVTYVGRAGTVYGPLTTPPTAAGKYTASAGLSGDANHTDSSNSKDFEITAKPVTVATADAGKVYGTLDPAPLTSADVSGFVVADGITASVGRDTGEAVNTYHITTTLNDPNTKLGNYTVTNTGATFTISAASISGTVLYSRNTSIPVPAVTMSSTVAPPSVVTNLSGVYTLPGFSSGSYTVTPSKTEACGSPFGVQANDASLVSQHVVHLITLDANQLAAAKVETVTPDLTTFDAALIAQQVVCIVNGVNLAGNWKFNPASRTYPSISGNLASENYQGFLLGDVDGSWSANPSRPELLSQPTRDSINVSVPALTASAGTVVTVPFRVENLGGRAVGAYQFDIEYDPAVIAPADIAADLEGTLGSNLSIASNSPEPGRLKVAVYGAFPATGDGTYVNLRFTVIGGAGSATPLNISNVVINDGTSQVFALAGSLSVTASSNNGVLRGRLLSASGRPVGNARVTVTNTMSSLRSAVTNPFGLFEFGNLSVGETYTVTVESKRYTFTPRTVSITDGVVDLDMIAEQ